MKTFFRLRLQVLFFALGLGLRGSFALAQGNPTVPQQPSVDPSFSKIQAHLESQPIKNAKLLYWDQALADVLGIKTAPGRVGVTDFDHSVLSQVAYEIQENATKLSEVDSTKGPNGSPRIFVEKDAHGGSGRAGYIKVGDAWVNIKGIGLTGEGNTSGKKIGPPSLTYTSHRDGSATLEEAIKEAIYSRVADSELKYGASKVLAIVWTGRTIKYPDGNEVPLATIVRAPLKRLDQAKTEGLRLQSKISESMGQANASRIMKGDLVNDSNIGGHGEMIDFGCLTHTCGFSRSTSSQNATLLSEGQSYVDGTSYQRAIGKYLVNQMGIPEAHLNTAEQAGGFVKDAQVSLGQKFKTLVTTANPVFVLDFEHVPDEVLDGNVKIHKWFESIAGDLLRNPGQTKEDFTKEQLAKARALTDTPSAKIDAAAEAFSAELWEALHGVVKANSVRDPAAYANAVAQIANFKNRSIKDTVRTVLFSKAAAVARDFGQNADAGKVQHVIDEIVLHNRTSTTPASEGLFHVTADEKATHLYLRADPHADGTHGLFAFPEKPRARKDEILWIRATTDSWKGQKDFPAKRVKSAYGDMYRIDIPHGSMPVTEDRLVFTPFYKNRAGSTRFLANVFNITGPRFLYNERLGLPANYVREDGIMRRAFGVRIFPTAAELEGKKYAHYKPTAADLLGMMNAKAHTAVEDFSVEFKLLSAEERAAVLASPEMGAHIKGVLESPAGKEAEIKRLFEMGAIDPQFFAEWVSPYFGGKDGFAPSPNLHKDGVRISLCPSIACHVSLHELPIGPSTQPLLAGVQNFFTNPQRSKDRASTENFRSELALLEFYKELHHKMPHHPSGTLSPERLSSAYRSEVVGRVLSPRSAPLQKLKGLLAALSLPAGKAEVTNAKIIDAALDGVAKASASGEAETIAFFRNYFFVQLKGKADEAAVISRTLERHKELKPEALNGLLARLQDLETNQVGSADLVKQSLKYLLTDKQLDSVRTARFLERLLADPHLGAVAVLDPNFGPLVKAHLGRDVLNGQKRMFGIALEHDLLEENKLIDQIHREAAKGGTGLVDAEIQYLLYLKKRGGEAYQRSLKARFSDDAKGEKLLSSLKSLEVQTRLNFENLALDALEVRPTMVIEKSGMAQLISSLRSKDKDVSKRALQVLKHIQQPEILEQKAFLNSLVYSVGPWGTPFGNHEPEIKRTIQSMITDHFLQDPKWMDKHPDISTWASYPEPQRLQKSAVHVQNARNRRPAVNVAPNCTESLRELFHKNSQP